jgi:enoyl-CoA hydratase/carnithine racemase
MPQAREMAREFADGPTFALSTTKRMLHREWDMGIEDALDAEAQAQALCMQTEDFRRAYRAFVEKKTPKFEGN